MTLHELAINSAKQSLQKMAAADIDKTYNGDIGSAAKSLYEKHLKKLKQELNTDDEHLECGTVISDGQQIVRFVNEDSIPD